tara:strand:+ start:3142 stop:3948 length:807 start_codon:yes stop_codon:yes gene_type:complete
MFDKVIVSTNEDPRFIEFLPIVSAAWKKFFPECDLHVAYVTDRNEDDPLIEKMNLYANVHLFSPIEGIPTPNHAKVARHILASQFGDSVCMLEDIDTIPLQREYYEERTSHRKKNTVLAVGAEVLRGTPHEGKFPMSTITAEGHVFSNLLNPLNLSTEELIKSWKDLEIFDHKEAINNPPNIFSDESLIRALIYKSKDIGVTHVDRAVDIKKDWIDRSWWFVNTERLFSGEYIACNFLRPFHIYYDNIVDIIEYIYGEKLEKNQVVLR